MMRALSLRNCATSSIGLHRRRKPDRLRLAAASDQRIEPRQRQRQMRAALVVRHRVDLVDDQRAHVRSISREPSAVSRM